MKSTKSLQTALYWVLGALMFIPLSALVMHLGITTYFPYIAPASFAFRILVEIAAVLWVILMIRDPQYRLAPTSIAWIFGIFMVIIGIADLFGINPVRSFWSNFERMEGFIGWLHLFFLFCIVAATVRVERVWIILARVAYGVAVLSAILGLLVNDGMEDSRVSGIIGNPIYLAIYMLFATYLVLYCIAYRMARGSKETGWHWVGYIASLALFVGTIIATGTRGTFVALAGSLFVATVGIAFFGKGMGLIRKAAIVLAALIVVGSVSLYAARDTQFVSDVTTLNRAASIFNLGHSTAAARFENWKIAWDGFKERPILGWGQDNYLYVFAYHYNPEMYGQEPWFDRTHNVVLDWLIASGALGLLAYLALFGAAIVETLRSTKLSRAEKWVLIGLFVGYFIHNLFVFDYLISAMLYMVALAYVHHSVERARVVPVKQGIPNSELSDGILYGVSAAVLLIVLYIVNVPGIRANMAVIGALSSNNPDVQIEHFKRAIDAGPLGRTETIEQFVQMSLMVRRASLPEEYKTRYAQAAGDAIMAEDQARPNNVRTLTFLGTYQLTWGYVDEGVATFEKARELAPRRQINLTQLVSAYHLADRHEDALNIAREAYELQKENDAARLTYAAALIYVGQKQEATELLNGLSATSTQDYIATLLPAYEASKQYADAVALLKPLSVEDPNNLSIGVRLASNYMALGQRANAIAVLETLKGVATDTAVVTQINEIIAALKAGKTPVLSF